jgi:hypothetical protein
MVILARPRISLSPRSVDFSPLQSPTGDWRYTPVGVFQVNLGEGHVALDHLQGSVTEKALKL